jgi:hypothetical protein
VLVDFGGDPADDASEAYESVVVVDEVPQVLRADGKLFQGDVTEPVLDLKNSEYRGLVLGTALPDLANVKNQAPLASTTTLTAPEGTDLSVPVIVVDRDLPAASLVVDVVPETLPAGASFDPVERVLTWPAAGPKGTYKVKITVSDGIAKPLNAVQTLNIKPPNTAEKNIEPTLAQVKGANALVGLPFELPLSGFDLDGDPVTITLNPNAPPLPAGASFDEGTQTLTWDSPQLTDTGTHEFKFLVSDGTKEVKKVVKVKVQSSLLTF